jgi:hypothetical protein
MYENIENDPQWCIRSMELALDQGNAYLRMNGKRLKNPEVVYRLSIAERALRVNNLSNAYAI